MKVPQPKNGCYYIQRLYTYGWDIALIDVNFSSFHEANGLNAALRHVRELWPDVQFRIARAQVSVSFEVVNE